MVKIAHIHLEGPLIEAAKALIIEKPVSLGWNSQLPEGRWAFIFKGAPSERAIKTAKLAGFDFDEQEGYSSISLPGVKESEVKTAVERFDVFAETYKDVSKKAASILNQHINEDATVVRKIKVKAGRKQLMSTAECIRQLSNTLLYFKS